MGDNVIYVRQKGIYKGTKMTYANLNKTYGDLKEPMTTFEAFEIPMWLSGNDKIP